ncbi:metal ABC transporter solute-binding protein, Zn/Mn family [Candidatus Poriferisodalis sp.]|uniref:metal ABC transporter solute-binding protein, Zn/Mn family n=1 Tax=Candidatus Poriferisodalis sp. TaxID=3101277 RepID=UPI003B019171
MSSGAEDEERPQMVVTTSIWADVVANVACDGIAEVVTVMPPGADPHTFEASLQDRSVMSDAHLVVANGLGLEEGLVNTLEAVEGEGIPVFRFTDHINTIEAAGGHHDHDDHTDEHDEAKHDEHEGHDDESHDDHDDHSDENEEHDHEDEHDSHDHEGNEHNEHEGHDHEDEHDEDNKHESHDHEDDGHEGHDHSHAGGMDPHVWFDPVRVAASLPELAKAISAIEGVDATEVEACLEDYTDALNDAHDQVSRLIDQLPPEHRKMVTNHDAFGYFADRYGFEVIGTVIPSRSTRSEASMAQLEELSEIIDAEGVPAIFSENTHETDTAEAVASVLDDIEVVQLTTGSLTGADGPASTYIDMLVSNAERIVEALMPAS